MISKERITKKSIERRREKKSLASLVDGRLWGTCRLELSGNTIGRPQLALVNVGPNGFRTNQVKESELDVEGESEKRAELLMSLDQLNYHQIKSNRNGTIGNSTVTLLVNFQVFSFFSFSFKMTFQLADGVAAGTR